MAHPIQACLTLGSTTVFASASQLTAFSLGSSTPAGTSNTHSKLIRYLAACSSPSLGDVVVSTGEDKLLCLHSLPTLSLIGKFELNKRANAIAISKDERIVVGDKFGDVYEYQLDLSTISIEQQKAGPILGHVSMLTSLTLVPGSESQRALVVSGDRDEHIRVSRFPRGHNIERFLFGSTKFVAALAYLPATATTPAAIVSGGGDSTLSTFNLETGERLSTIDVETALLPQVIVAPLPPAPVQSGKKKGAKRIAKHGDKPNTGLTTTPIPDLAAAKASESAEGTPEVFEAAEEEDLDPMGELDVEPEEGEELDGDEGEIREDGEETFVRREYGMHAWKDGVTTGLAVHKLVVVAGGVLVLASGCAALSFIPSALIFPSATPATATPNTLSLLHPILDLTLHSSTHTTETFVVTLDLSRGPKPAVGPAVRRVELVEGALKVVAAADEDAQWATSAAVPYSSTVEKPTAESLYPTLSIMHHPDSGAAFLEGGDEGAGGMSKKERKAAAKAAAAEAEEEDDGIVEEVDIRMRNGKRAAGRRLIQERLAEAKKAKLAKDSPAPEA